MAKVNWFENVQDFRVLVLGNMGFSTDYIVQRTKLTPGQVLYRLGKGKVRRMDYRSGNSPLAIDLMKRNQTVIDGYVTKQISGKNGPRLKLRKLA